MQTLRREIPDNIKNGKVLSRELQKEYEKSERFKKILKTKRNEEICKLYSQDGYSQVDLAREFNISPSMIKKILNINKIKAHHKQLRPCGTLASYQRGCKCEKCAEFYRKFKLDYIHRKRAKGLCYKCQDKAEQNYTMCRRHLKSLNEVPEKDLEVRAFVKFYPEFKGKAMRLLKAVKSHKSRIGTLFAARNHWILCRECGNNYGE